MTQIQIVTRLHAPIETVFDLSTDIGVHMESASKSKEQAIAGVTFGRIRLSETVTWKGRHFGFLLTHQSKITAFECPTYFVDEMLKGCFRSFRHEHYFEYRDGITTMTDRLFYETPLGIFGWIFDRLLIERHLTRFLIDRNRFIKIKAEFMQMPPTASTK